MSLPVCCHAETFECHGDIRCSHCFTDAMYLPDPHGATLLFVGAGQDNDRVTLNPTTNPFLGPHPSPADDLRWFASEVDQWLNRGGSE